MFIVTGGAGLIGSAVIWKLNRMGISDVLAVDHIGNSDKWKNLAPLRYRDYMEKDEFRKALAEGKLEGLPLDGVFHLGACSSTTERNGSYLIDNNFKCTCEVAEFCLRKKVRLVYASSCATYGDGRFGYNDDLDRIEELRPMNMYGYSKQMFDLYARQRGYFKFITGCKFSNVYGPNERHKGEMRSVICRAFEQITADGRLRLFKSCNPQYGDGESMRDFLYVKDAVDMMWYLFNHKNGCGIFNIGSGKAERWNFLAEGCFKALKKPFNVEYIDMPEHLRDRYQYYTKANMEKLYSLGYDREPTPLHDAIADYFCNYRLPDLYLGDE